MTAMKRGLILGFLVFSTLSYADFDEFSKKHDGAHGASGTNSNRWVCYVHLDAKVRSENLRCGKKQNMNSCGADDIHCEWDIETLHCIGKTFYRCKRQGVEYCHTYRFSKKPSVGARPSDGRRYRCDASQSGDPLVPLSLD
jgi:hypothetical protein